MGLFFLFWGLDSYLVADAGMGGMLLLWPNSKLLRFWRFYFTSGDSFWLWLCFVHLFGQYNRVYIGNLNRLRQRRKDFFLINEICPYFLAGTVIDLYVQAFTNIFFEVFASVNHTLLVEIVSIHFATKDKVIVRDHDICHCDCLAGVGDIRKTGFLRSHQSWTEANC